jgi:hypothetical protein
MNANKTVEIEIVHYTCDTKGCGEKLTKTSWRDKVTDDLEYSLERNCSHILRISRVRNLFPELSKVLSRSKQ